jgi:quercetin dioxygenase-like cupin family protein
MDRVTEPQRKSEEVADGVHLADLAAGEHVSMKHWRVEPGETLPAHRHHNEQIGYVISGTLTAVVEGEEYELAPGDSYVFPSDERHGAENRADEPAVGIGVLSPPRGAPKWGEKSHTSEPTPAESDD